MRNSINPPVDAKFAALDPPTTPEIDAAEFLLLITSRRRFPGTPLNQNYMALAMAIDAVITGYANLNPDTEDQQHGAAVLKALAAILGTILGDQIEPNGWHEEIERLVRDIYATAREQRQERLP